MMKPPERIFSTCLLKSDSAMRPHRKEAEKYREFIREACSLYDFQESLMAGIGSRESGWGVLLKPPGPKGSGDFAPRKRFGKHRHLKLPPDNLGFGRGLLQIDFDFHEFARTGNWRDPRENILYGVKLLHSYRKIIAKNTEYYNIEFHKAVISSYNAGPGGIIRAYKHGLKIDSVTTGGNYSEDVLNRAGYFQLFGWK